MNLSNRFDKNEVKSFWAFHYFDIMDDKNDADCLHHIKSPQSQDYIEGEHNTSVLNSCPLNNFRNHIHKNLHDIKTETKLIKEVIRIALQNEYRFNEKDVEFLKKYKIL